MGVLSVLREKGLRTEILPHERRKERRELEGKKCRSENGFFISPVLMHSRR
jgi:hypothetical protein